MPTLVFAGEGFFAPEDGAIHSFTLADGALTPGPVTKQGGTFPMWLETHPSKPVLYAVYSPDASAEGSVCAYTMAPDGTLTPLGDRQPVGGSVPCHCEVLDTTLLVANYVGGTICAVPILEDGSLGAAGCVVDHVSGTGTHLSGRQAGAHPHMITASPDGKFVFVVDLGTNSVVGYTLAVHDRVACSRSLTKHTEFAVHDSAGPRHMAFSPTAPFAYILNELDNTIVPVGCKQSTVHASSSYTTTAPPVVLYFTLVCLIGAACVVYLGIRQCR
jgi:6-phosphogluconolactonase (cycloisomerase 2 family)